MDFASHRLAGKWVEVKRATPASQLQDMFPGEAFDEEMYGMTIDEIMAAAAMGMPIHDYMLAAWDGDPCDESTPMSLASIEASSGSARSHPRGRRARRRKQRDQKPGSNCDAEDYSDDGQSPTGFSMPDTPLSEVAFISTSNSCSTTASPTAAASPLSAWAKKSESNALGPLSTDRALAPAAGTIGQRPRVSSGGKSLGGLGSPGASENDPSRANMSTSNSDQPMKVTCEGGFTREDFLSLEVGRPWLSAW